MRRDAFFLFLLLGSALSAKALGTFECLSNKVVKDIIVQINLDSNEMMYRHREDAPDRPENWKAIFKASEVFCGYAPSHPENVKCSFAREDDVTSGMLSKNLNCIRTYDNESDKPLTIGVLRMNTSELSGSLKCSIFTNPAFDLKLTNCHKI